MNGDPVVTENPTSTDQLWCCSLGHEAMPAAALGVYDDGVDATPQTPYCADCAQTLIRAREYTVTRVLNPLALGTSPCPSCGGSGRLATATARPAQVDPTPAVAEVDDLILAHDDTPPEELTALFYAQAYWELRMAVDGLLAEQTAGRAHR